MRELASLLAVLAVCGTTLYLWRELKPLMLRVLAVHERRYHADPSTDRNGPGDPMPDDLLGVINTLSTGSPESDDILRSQTVALLYEKYGELGDWDKVRAWSAVNIGTDTRADGWGLA